MKKRNLINVLSVVFALALIVFALFYSDFSIEMITFSAVTVVFMIVMRIRDSRHKKLGIIVQDELSEKIALKSFRSSWLVTVSSLCICSWFGFLNVKLPETSQLITMLLFVMILSFHMSRFIFSKKLEAE